MPENQKKLPREFTPGMTNAVAELPFVEKSKPPSR